MKKIFIRGIIAIAPLALTLGILFWLFNNMEALLGPKIKLLVGSYYVPGMGVLTAIVLLFAMGCIINTWIITKISQFIDSLLEKIPVCKSIYKMIKNVTFFFQKSQEAQKNSVVKVTLNGITLIGFVTREDFNDLPSLDKDKIAVYLPMSYQIGGYCIFVNKSTVERIDMSTNDTLQYSLIAWAKKTTS